MKKIDILYRVFTGILIPALGIGSVNELMGNSDVAGIYIALGYPAYLSPFLGAARILALITIIVPKFSKLKEWAYAGLTFDVIGAIYSILVVRHSLVDSLFPIVILGCILASYFLYHKRNAQHTVVVSQKNFYQ